MANPVALPGTVVSSGAAVSPGGAQGVSGTPAWTTNTSGFTIPNVGSTVSVTVADASWIVVGEMVYVDQAGGGVGLSGVLQVQSKSGNTLTLLNPSPPSAIPPADNTQAGLLKQLSGNATDYVGGDNACHSIAASITATSGFISKTAAYTLQAADSGKYVICSGGSWTLTLPVPVVGFNYRLRNDMGISGTVGTITLQPLSGTIDGQASIPLLPQQECTLITDGANWRTHGLKREVILGTLNITSATLDSGTILLPVGFRYFLMQFQGVRAAGICGLFANLSFNGGSTWQTGNHYWGAMYDSTNTTVAYVQSQAATSLYFSDIGSTAGVDALVEVMLFPGSAGSNPTYIAKSTQYLSSNGRAGNETYGGFLNTPGIANAMHFYLGAGNNILQCFFTLKGVV